MKKREDEDRNGNMDKKAYSPKTSRKGWSQKKVWIKKIGKWGKGDETVLHGKDLQEKLGAQSSRGISKDLVTKLFPNDKHEKKCFEKMLKKEKKMCGKWAVFYHLYSNRSSLIYEVQAAIAHIKYGFDSSLSSLPRLLQGPFNETPFEIFTSMCERFNDHQEEFRSLGIAANTSLLSESTEATPVQYFSTGYSCHDVKYSAILREVLLEFTSVWFVDQLIEKIRKHAYQNGLRPDIRVGYMMQVFISRDLVDSMVYPSYPYGSVDFSRMPISEKLNGAKQIVGQCRILAEPAKFMKKDCVKIYNFCSSSTFQKNRKNFQKTLISIIRPYIIPD